MTVRHVDNKHITGLSSDVKPTVATSSEVELNDIFTETDTGNKFITYDGTNWVGYFDESAAWERKVAKVVTFAGATPNAIGDFNGTGNPTNVFTVTGEVVAKFIAVGKTTLTFDANATIALGIAGGSQIIAVTDLTVEGLAANEIWHDTTPDAEIELLSVQKQFIITDGNDVQLTVGVANVNTGSITFYCLWYPLSADGNVVAA